MEIKLDTKVALQQFEKRKAKNAKTKQINNARLRAGSPMTYYCEFCGDVTAILSESFWGTPPTVCEPCKVLRAHGLI